MGVGFTRIVAVTGTPEHSLALGVMVKVTITGELVVLVKLPLMLVLPLVAIPVTDTALSLVQLKLVEDMLPERTIVVIALAEQIV